MKKIGKENSLDRNNSFMNYFKNMDFDKIEFDEKKRKYYRFFLVGILSSCFCVLGILSYINFYSSIPNDLSIREGEEEELHFALPVSATIYADSVQAGSFMGEAMDDSPRSIEVMSTNQMLMKANECNSYQMDLKLFGVIPFKTVSLDVVEEQKVYPVGLPIGVYVKTSGTLVVGISGFENSEGITVEPAKNILKEGDYILEINHEEVTGKKDLINKIRKCNGEDLILTVLRNNEEVQIKLKPVLADDGEYKVGIWIRDSAQGIGTLTYLDQNGNYGALGHGINDVDTNTLMELNYGGIYTTEIVGIKKGEDGTPGELTGIIDFDDSNLLGNVALNTKGGIFGRLSAKKVEELNLTDMEVALKQEIKPGKASVLCKIENESKLYEVEILKVDYESKDNNRGIVLEITDKELLELTGGIVQGMSGAPIIQNGKVIGAVTHVLINDSTRGYGIFIEEMLEH